MILNNDFIGLDDRNSILEFDGEDEKNAFKQGLQTQPEDWYYRNVKITYELNSLGHRCVDIENLNFENYILFFGCSHTYGVGLELEKTFPYLVSKKLNCDYYNLSVSGTGIDVVEHNLATWFFKFNKKPKAVIIQWPDYTRFLSINSNYTNLIPCGTWSEDPYVQKLIATFDMTGVGRARVKIITDIIEMIIGEVPLVTLTYSKQRVSNNRSLYFRRLDLARDLSHLGIKSHQDLANSVIEHLPPYTDK